MEKYVLDTNQDSSTSRANEKESELDLLKEE